MDIRSFFKRKDPTTADVASKGLPATPLLKNEDAKRKNDTLSSGITNASRQKKVRSSPEAISRGENTCVGSSKEARSRLSQQGNTDADLDELLEDAVTSSSLSKSNAQGMKACHCSLGQQNSITANMECAAVRCCHRIGRRLGEQLELGKSRHYAALRLGSCEVA
eukprot:SAG31_NODE_2043_length_6582_cov_2.798952_10_plen_165_part_00